MLAPKLKKAASQGGERLFHDIDITIFSLNSVQKHGIFATAIFFALSAHGEMDINVIHDAKIR